jgi:tRNA/tmRNA/rRNA uracil-C5-methylase (TrmA/RlmC/RlmD family)
VFVPGVLPGETVEVRFVRRHKNFSEATLIEVTQPSPKRITPVCPLAAVCPGCCYQHADYAEEVRLKQAQLANFLQRQARIDSAICLPPVPAPEPLGYRNKISLHAASDGSSTRLGYVGEDNVTVIDVPACPLALPPLNERLARLRADADFMKQLTTHRSLTLRCTPQDGVIHFFGKADEGPWLTETTILGKVHAPRGSFFQVNRGVADRLLSTVMEILKSTQARTVIDLYCGVGVFALAAGAAGLPRVIGIDRDDAGIQAARWNADDRKLKGMEFMAQPAAKGLKQTLRRVDPAGTLLIVDPPRTGLEKQTVETIARAKPAEIVYVSCAADTLSRDVALLKASGYGVVSSQLFDMFPRTPHFETITRLTAG